MTRDQEYQITECVRERRDGATCEELRAKGYAEKAIRISKERTND